MNCFRGIPLLALTFLGLLVSSTAVASTPPPQAEADATQATQPNAQQPPTGEDLAKQAAEMRRLSEKIEALSAFYSAHPRHKVISASTQTLEYREYMEVLVKKIEAVAAANYPDEAKHLSGRAILTISIGIDGKLLGTLVNVSSGETILDDAAVRFVELASPFAPIPAIDGTEVLEIVRTFQFHSSSEAVEPAPRRSK
jgi:protein TonB